MLVHFGCNYDVHSAEGQLKVTEKRSGEKQAGITKPFSNKWMFLLFESHRRVNLIFKIKIELYSLFIKFIEPKIVHLCVRYV